MYPKNVTEEGDASALRYCWSKLEGYNLGIKLRQLSYSRLKSRPWSENGNLLNRNKARLIFLDFVKYNMWAH